MIKQISTTPTCRWQCRTCSRIFEMDVLPHDPKEPTSCPWGCEMKEIGQFLTDAGKVIPFQWALNRRYKSPDGLQIPGWDLI